MLERLKRLWFLPRDVRDARAFVHERVGDALLTHNPRHTVYVRAYHRYCVELFRDALHRHPATLQFVFGDYPPADSALPLRRVAFQIEHTLVKPGGSDAEGAPPSRTPLPDRDGVYLARLLHRPTLAAADLIIEYSHANLRHLQDSGDFNDLLAKTILIAPLLHEPCFRRDGRDLPALTLFSDAGAGRRGRWLAAAQSGGLPIRNLKRCFDSTALQAQYRRTRVLVNLRRSDHHDTIEELRILPALQSGVIVVSEDGPLRHTLPYADFIVWAKHDDLIERSADVLRNYDAWHARIFADPALPRVLDAMAGANRSAVESMLLRCAGPVA